MVVLLAVALVAAALTGCSGASQPSRTARTVQVTRGVTVTFPKVPSGARLPKITAHPAPDTTAALAKPVRVAGHRFPSALTVLAPAQHLAAFGPLPAGGVILSFHLDPRRVPAGTIPFLASLDTATGRWVPVASSYNRATGVVSARVTHFSLWAPLGWLKSVIASALKGALVSLFGLAGIGAAPSCGGQPVTVTDSRPNGGVGACAEANGNGQTLAKIVDQRPYPIDVLYPPSAQVDVPSTDAFAQFGETITNLVSNWHDRVLLPGGGEADATIAIPAGRQAQFATEADTEAYLFGILGTGVRVLAEIGGGLQLHIVKALLDALDKTTCLRDEVQAAQTATLSLATAENIGSVGFECIASAAKGIGGAIFTLATLAGSLITELVSGIWAAIDTAVGNADHLLTVQALAPVTVYLAAGQAIGGAALYRPVTAQISGDATYFLSNMTWSAWTATTAVGTGTALLDDCNPSCAAGHIYHVPVQITLTQPVKACKTTYNGPPGARYFWSHADFTYPSGVPPPVSPAFGNITFQSVVQQAHQSCGQPASPGG